MLIIRVLFIILFVASNVFLVNHTFSMQPSLPDLLGDSVEMIGNNAKQQSKQTVSKFEDEVLVAEGTAQAQSLWIKIKPSFENWLKAWSNKDIEEYLDSYHPLFSPADGSSVEQWKKTRTKRLSKPQSIYIEIDNIEFFYVDEQLAEVTFDQQYQSTNYRDKVRKKTAFRRSGDTWKVYSEEQLKTY